MVSGEWPSWLGLPCAVAGHYRSIGYYYIVFIIEIEFDSRDKISSFDYETVGRTY